MCWRSGVGGTRLIEVTADLPPRTVSVNLPKDFNQALGKRSHLARPGGMAGAEESSEAALLTRYARTVDAALRHTLVGQEAPLIVAASEPLASIYRRISTYPHTSVEVIAGSADDTPDHVLATEARKILDRIYVGEIEELQIALRHPGRAGARDLRRRAGGSRRDFRSDRYDDGRYGRLRLRACIRRRRRGHFPIASPTA